MWKMEVVEGENEVVVGPLEIQVRWWWW